MGKSIRVTKTSRHDLYTGLTATNNRLGKCLCGWKGTAATDKELQKKHDKEVSRA